MIHLGIDPGLDGAVAAISPNGALVSLVPTFKGKGSRRIYDVRNMAELIMNIGYEARPEKRFVILEKQQAFPGQGLSSTFSIGRGFGLWEGILVGLRLPYVVVAPRKWQKEICPGKKGESKIKAIEFASRLFPGTPLRVSAKSKKPHTGFADALCLAEYGRRLQNV